MPVILTTPEEVDLWLGADVPTALELQRPLPDEALRIVASGEKEDRAIGVFEEQSPLF
jgi:putative SOS response-associated peptidase YedK